MLLLLLAGAGTATPPVSSTFGTATAKVTKPWVAVAEVAKPYDSVAAVERPYAATTTIEQG